MEDIQVITRTSTVSRLRDEIIISVIDRNALLLTVVDGNHIKVATAIVHNPEDVIEALEKAIKEQEIFRTGG